MQTECRAQAIGPDTSNRTSSEVAMKIAVYIDGQDQLVSLYEPGRFCVYQGGGGDWTRTQEIAFAVGDSTSLAAIKSEIASAVAQLDGCEVLLSGSVKGFLYSYLQEEFGFRIWKSEGVLLKQLAEVELYEVERAEQQRSSSSSCAVAAGCASGGCGGGRARRAVAAPVDTARVGAATAAEDLGSGCFRIDLISALSGDAKLNSRQILLPILEGTAFDKLEILCDHLPKWFAPKLRELNLKADCAPLETGHGVKAIVSHAGGCGQQQEPVT
jgi:Fe-only nitrogenase accessory protein AnfO